jgi:hypothetical protein
VGTTEVLLGRKCSGSGLENRDYVRRDPTSLPRGTLYPQTLALTSPTSGGSSVGIVRSRTQAKEFREVCKQSNHVPWISARVCSSLNHKDTSSVHEFIIRSNSTREKPLKISIQLRLALCCAGDKRPCECRRLHGRARKQLSCRTRHEAGTCVQSLTGYCSKQLKRQCLLTYSLM